MHLDVTPDELHELDTGGEGHAHHGLHLRRQAERAAKAGEATLRRRHRAVREVHRRLNASAGNNKEIQENKSSQENFPTVEMTNNDFI